jgi:hypothetical protein
VLDKPAFTVFQNYASKSDYFINLSLSVFIVLFVLCSVVPVLTVCFLCSLQVINFLLAASDWLLDYVLSAIFGCITANCCMLYII